MSSEEFGDLSDIELGLDGSSQIGEQFAQVYELLCDNESQYMVPFRAMLQKVCRALNEKDWRDVCAVTDDFVVVPAGGSVHFGDDYVDIVQSVSIARLDLLRSHGLGVPTAWAG